MFENSLRCGGKKLSSGGRNKDEKCVVCLLRKKTRRGVGYVKRKTAHQKQGNHKILSRVEGKSQIKKKSKKKVSPLGDWVAKCKTRKLRELGRPVSKSYFAERKKKKKMMKIYWEISRF